VVKEKRRERRPSLQKKEGDSPGKSTVRLQNRAKRPQDCGGRVVAGSFNSKSFLGYGVGFYMRTLKVPPGRKSKRRKTRTPFPDGSGITPAGEKAVLTSTVNKKRGLRGEILHQQKPYETGHVLSGPDGVEGGRFRTSPGGERDPESGSENPYFKQGARRNLGGGKRQYRE